MINSVRDIFKTATFRQSMVTFGGTAINGALGAVFFILVARFLGPSSYGLITIAFSVLTLTADIGDLGTNTGLVRFVGEYAKKDSQKAYKFLKLSLEVKVMVGLFLILLGLIISPFLASRLFYKPELESLLPLAFIGATCLILFSFVVQTLQAYQRFWSWSIIQILTNFIRLMTIVSLFIFALMSESSTIVVYLTMPLLGFFIGLLILPKAFFKVKGEWRLAGKFFHYSKWVALFSIISAIASRLDIFISARLLDSTQVGYYSAANQVTMIVPQIVAALGTVIAPKMASMGSFENFISYFKKTQVLVSFISILGLLSIPALYILIPLLYGPSYASAIPLFVVLLIAMLVFLFSVPIHNAVIYYYSFPKLFLWTAIVYLAIIALLGWNLVSQLGAMGAAITVLVGSISNLFIPSVWLYFKIKSR